MGLSFGKNDQEQSNKSVNRFEFPYQLLSGLDRTVGRPFSMQELFSMRPVGRGLSGRGVFGGSAPTGGQGQGLGFGQTSLSPNSTLPQGTGSSQGPGLGFPTPQPENPTANEAKFTANDLIGVVERIAPDKAGDVGRLMTKGGLDPTGFTISDLEKAWSKFGDSTGNTKAVMAALLGTLSDAQNIQTSYQTPRRFF